MRVCHLTSAHPPDDVRIFHKECRSLATHGFDVTLIAPGQSSYEEGGVKIEAIPPRKLRSGRFLFGTWDVSRYASGYCIVDRGAARGLIGSF